MKILKPGHNSWRSEHAAGVRYLIDGASFFPAFRRAALEARHTIWILGWDIHSDFELCREDPEDGWPTRLAPFLDALVRRRERLEVRVLNWDYSLLVAADRQWITRLELGWKTHPRLQYRLDAEHPPGASHHQKVVVIDDTVAFVGGLDFTRGRWDRQAHAPGDPLRADPSGAVPRPYHDVQVMVEGEVASALGDLCRERWRRSGADPVEALPPAATRSRWADAEPDLVDVPVAVARTCPQHAAQSDVREIETLLVNAIEAAQRTIYIENQYFTAPSIARALEQRLAEPGGPEVVLAMPWETVGWLSQNTMDVLRERRVQSLTAADREGRLRCCYAHRDDLDGEAINLHSKVMVVDDDFLCVGSANLNNRSMYLDTECNLAIESAGRPDRQRGIARLRDRLLAEHLGLQPHEVTERLASTGSLVELIEERRGGSRSLEALPLRVTPEQDARVPETAIADPEGPIDGQALGRRLLAKPARSSSRRGLVWLVVVMIAALALASAWRWSPLADQVDLADVLGWLEGWRGAWQAPLLVAAIFVLGGLAMVPVTLMIVASGAVFGAAWGFGYALLGAELSALVAYAIGHWLGRESLEQVSRRWVVAADRFLAQQGLLATITLRIVPVAPFTVVNLAAGASGISFRDFALGTLLGLLPGTLALVVVSDRVMAALKSPSLEQIALAAGLAGLVIAGSAWVTRRLRKANASGSS